MAGINLGRNAYMPGKTWDESRQAWLTPDDQDFITSAHIEATRPMFVTSPTGAVYRSSTANGGGWDTVGQIPSVDALGRVSGSSGSGSSARTMDPEIRARMLSMIDSLNSPTAMPPGPASYAPRYEEEAERAALTASKERAGQRMQASVRGLDSMLARRGISSSGIHARGLAELLANNQSEQAGTDRQIIQNRTSRARTVDDANFNAQLQYNTQVGQMQMADRQRLQQLLSAYGMFY